MRSPFAKWVLHKFCETYNELVYPRVHDIYHALAPCTHHGETHVPDW